MGDRKDEADRKDGHGFQKGDVTFKGGRGSFRNVQKSQLEKLMANPVSVLRYTSTKTRHLFTVPTG